MQDYLDFLQLKDDEVLTGTFYARRPVTVQDKGITFQYDIVDENDKSYSTILQTMTTEQSFQTIKTNDDCGFAVNSYVATQDGGFWTITGVVKRLIKHENKQALRFLKQTIDTEFVIRLLQVDNPMGLK